MGHVNGAPVEFRSSTQKTVALFVTEGELYAAIMTAQDMLYVMHVLESIGLHDHIPMILEVDNKRTTDLANSWSIGGKTQHIDVHQTFFQKLKEEGKLLVKWLPGNDNDADMFTKNLDGPSFEQFSQVYVGFDYYAPDPSSREGVGS